jgi:cytochrome bd ubiquinol oxidase subunit II
MMEVELAYIMVTLLWFALIAYAVLGGADFGAGIWDLLALGRTAEKQRHLINHALGPVWEANHVWLIFLIVGLYTAFPVAFAKLSIALFLPFTLALLGIVLRGAAFIFRTYAVSAGVFTRVWSRVFSSTSTITPFVFGTVAAAVASGKIRIQGDTVESNLATIWLTPFALTIGLMAVSLCAVIAAIYLTVEAQHAKEEELVQVYRWRAFFAGAITATLGTIGLLLAPSEAPLLWNGMLNHALPLIFTTMLIGGMTAGMLLLQKYRMARAFIVLETAGLLGSWGISQLPYLIPPDVTVESAAGSSAMLTALLIGTLVGLAILLPSLWLLFRIFKSSK